MFPILLMYIFLIHFYVCLSSQVKLQEAIEYEDLENESGPKPIALNLKKSDRHVEFHEHYNKYSFNDAQYGQNSLFVLSATEILQEWLIFLWVIINKYGKDFIICMDSVWNITAANRVITK